ncbi:PiggyBac transposable element-derived protein 4 [Merluccius polli]|uniref:PiggyBac transposable element-derived protein 4 n=1 Tax=Merluccius polli TaxID=89951 RepID=A0AA47N8G0_MERPO|nr:PiggyBac transposable element-derived protein 4 [Merluccius polli]
MADAQPDTSEGSDINEEIDSEEKDETDDPLERAQWFEAMFGDEEACDFDGFQSEWATDDFRPREKMPYTRVPGIKIEMPNNFTPAEIFSQIFTEEMWMKITKETNLYADQTRSANPSSSKWVAVTVAEIKTFIGICLAMGVLDLPAWRDYWRQKKWLFQTNIPKAMSRDRFAIIWRYFHLQDNNATDVDRSDKLWKVRWYLNYLTQFQKLYEVNGFVTIDESMVKFKGRLAFQQYLPLKPTKWGIKVWVLAESSTGYVSNFQVYTGRDGRTEKGLAHRVVMDLVKPYYGSHLFVVMDNFYSGVPLFEDLKAHGVDACGTIRANRKGIPPKPQAMAKHQYQVAQKDDLTFCAWQDTKVVMVLSNYHNPSATGTVTRKKGGHAQTNVTVPACLADYQKHMKGVDLLDQMVGYYQFQHRSKKWWRRLFFFFLSVGCYNSFIVARGAEAAYKSSYKEWVEDLAQELITPVTSRSAPQSPAGPSRASAEHDCQKIFEKRKVCWECSQAKSGTGVRTGATVYVCRQCQVPLHIECFGKHCRR